MRTPSLLVSALLVSAPFAALLPGCSGSSSGGVSPTPTTTLSPTISTPTPTPNSTTRPTPTLVPFDSVRADLTFKASSDSNFVENQPYYADITPGGSKQNVSLSFATSGGSRLYGIFQNATQGKSYSPNSAGILTLPTMENTVGDKKFLFTFQGGTIKVTVLQKALAQLTFENAVFAPKADGNAGGAKGTVTINGTIGGPINGDFIGD